MKRLLLLALLAACSKEMSAQLPSAEGLAEGSPVMMHGTRVGSVAAIGLAGGDAPVEVTFKVEDSYEAIQRGACATSDGSALQLHSDRGLQPVQDERIVACPPTAADTLGDLIGEAVRATSMGLEQNAAEISRAAARAAGEQLRGAAEGLREGLGENGAREIGRILGEQARELAEGAAEGATAPPPPPAP